MIARSEIPERLVKILLAPANVALHGNPGSGKSWMANRVSALLTEQDGCRVVRLDLSTFKSGSAVFVEMAERCGGSGAFRQDGVRSAWKAARAAVAAVDDHVIFVFEEFDRVLKFEDGEDFLRLIRELVHLPGELGCAGIVVSRHTIDSIEANVRGISTLSSVFYTQYLGALSSADIGGLVKDGLGLTEGEQRECLEWSGGHPVLARYWLTVRPEAGLDLEAEYETVKIVLRVLDHLTSIDLLNATAQLVLGPVVDDLLLEKKQLELLGVIPSRGDGGVSLSNSEVFRQALRQATRGMAPWGLLGQAEVATRGVIETVLETEYGMGWPDVVSKKNRGVARAYQAAHEKIRQDERVFGRRAPWLSYTYPRDLWEIIQLEWDLFSSVFASRDKAYWRDVWTTLSQYRAPLAHGRPEVLGEVRMAQCRTYAEEVVLEIERAEARGRDALTGAEG